MTISVCMGTYNGEKYIEEQLYSILHQTKQPDEVILCDDGSADRTVKIIQNFISENQLEGVWKLYQNAENKGYPSNFYYASGLCTKDVVFFADQDDIWAEKKLERMCKVLEDNEDVMVVSCKFGLINAEGDDIHTIMKPTKSTGTGQLRRVTIKDVFYKFEWPGMVIAYRNEWYRKAVCESKKVPHDFMICARAAEENVFYQMDESLAFHRRHSNNVGGEEHRLTRLLSKSRKVREIEDYLKILDSFKSEGVLQSGAGKEALGRKYQIMIDRYEALQSGKISRIIRNAWKNRQDVRMATLVCDLIIVKMSS